MFLISSGDAWSFQMTIARALLTLPTQEERRAASSIFWILAALHGAEGQEEADRPPAPDDLFEFHTTPS